MIQMFCHGDEDSGPVCIIGLEQGNIDKLKEDSPAGVDLEEIGIDCIFCLSYVNDNGRCAMIKGAGMTFVLNEEMVASLISGRLLKLPLDGFTIMIFFVASKEKFQADLEKNGLIDAKTIVRHEGFSPSDVPPSLN